MEKQWAELSPDERQEALFQRWLSPKDHEGNDLKFKSAEAEKAYKERVTRIKDAVQLKKKPDRVPVLPIVGFFYTFYAGFTPKEVMYDYEKAVSAARKYVLELEPDLHMGAIGPGPGKFFDILDYKLYAWPGHGVSADHTYQCLEREYMKADEYDVLIQDPSNFYCNVYMPRIFGALQAFNAPSLSNVLEIFGLAFNFIPYGLPPIQAAYKTLMEAGNEALKWAGAMGAFNEEMAAAGFPAGAIGMAKAPFDTLGDTLRGTRGIMVDMYRQPDKVLKALEVLTPIMINTGAGPAKGAGLPLVFIPLHKGADGFMSDEQFKTFYWPTFRKLLMGLIDEGCVPFCFVEGSYNTRLKVIRDLPKGKTLWSFDTTDMAKAKEMLGDVACIGGNMPIDLLSVGTPKQVKDYAKKLIDTCGKGGGYLMANGVALDEAKPENVKAMIDFTKEYGVYK